MAVSRTLLQALETLRSQGEDSVVASVVKVEGSAYRRPGARMLIPRIGPHHGSVSGGCLEREIARKAWWLTEAGPSVRCYSTAEEGEEGETALGFGLGCNGRVHVMFERIAGRAPALLADALAAVERCAQPAALATVIASGAGARAKVGERLLLAQAGFQADLGDSALERQLRAELPGILAARRSCLQHHGQGPASVEVFLEYLAPMPRLVIFGAGHDAQPLVRMARLLDWHVTVIDARPHFARRERFPEADQVLVGDLAAPGELVRHLRGAAVAIMSHSLAQDERWLATALQAEPRYIGQLGPRDRTERLLASIQACHGQLPAMAALHYPIGLDLGGDAPESVAMAILAEIQAHLHGREGGQLRLRPSKVHPMDAARHPAGAAQQTTADGAGITATNL